MAANSEKEKDTIMTEFDPSTNTEPINADELETSRFSGCSEELQEETGEDMVSKILDKGEDEDFAEFDEGVKKPYILTAVAYSEVDKGSTCGSDVNNYLEDLFGVSWSPGTVYPYLHQLNDEGLLDLKENVRRKEYTLTKQGLEELETYFQNFLGMAELTGAVWRSAENKVSEDLTAEEEYNQRLQTLKKELK